MNPYKSCKICPRSCGVDRAAAGTGFFFFCSDLRIAAAVIHRGEEPPLVGAGGSGAIFISGCNLGCAFCQNCQISRQGLGRAVSLEEFARVCAALREKGAENINIVTGSHVIPAVVEGLSAAKKAGLDIPVLWNSSAYETTQTLELLKDHVDIYLPDLKTLDGEIARKFFNASDYPAAAEAAIKKMMDMTHNKEKIIVRHLILPGFLESSRSVLRWFAENASDCAQLSLMTQYTPVTDRDKPVPDRYLSKEEYEIVLQWLDEFNIEDGFIQELVTGSEWLPDFSRANPFSSELSVPVWHFKDNINSFFNGLK
jgi:putative pyruvate formate lyase activating enzyme